MGIQKLNPCLLGRVTLKLPSSYAIKSTIHAIGVKNIPIFPIHEVRAEGGGNVENCDL